MPRVYLWCIDREFETELIDIITVTKGKITNDSLVHQYTNRHLLWHLLTQILWLSPIMNLAVSFLP